MTMSLTYSFHENLATYMIVNCDDGTVNLTVREWLAGNQLGRVVERSGDFCGSAYVDREFLKFLEHKVGKSAVDILRDKNYDQLHYMMHEFFGRKVKIPFTGERSDFGKLIVLDIQRVCPALEKYVTGSNRSEMSDDEWEIELEFDTIKSFFDPVINKIIRLIECQLSKSPNVSVMFLVGGFSESPYLQSRIRKKFSWSGFEILGRKGNE